MSRIGKQPIKIPDKVDVQIKNNLVTITGPQGQAEREIDPIIEVNQKDSELILTRKAENQRARSLHGLYRSLIDNSIVGVTDGYQKTLEVIGVGYKIDLKGKALYLELGFSHALVFKPPEGIEFEIEVPKRRTEAPGTKNELLMGTVTVKGIDKQLVGNIAAKIRAFRPPVIYSGKGIRYKDEILHLKAGKAAF